MFPDFKWSDFRSPLYFIFVVVHQAAINLEISSEKISHVNVKIDGLNGQLPNLDLVNLIYRLCMREGIHQMFQGVEDHPRPDSWKGYTR